MNAFLVQKLLGHLAMPAGLVWVALGALAARSWRKGDRRGASFLLAAWVAYTLAGNPVVGHALQLWLTRDYAGLTPLAEGPFDAVFVLGGGTYVSPTGEAHANSDGDRVVLAARLYHAGRAKVLVCSGTSGYDGRSVARETARVLLGLGVPAAAIVELDGPLNTSEEIAAYKALKAAKGWRRAGLVTSASHMRRAQRLCAAEGIALEPLPANPPMEGPHVNLDSPVPQRAGFDQVESFSWEVLGSLIGR